MWLWSLVAVINSHFLSPFFHSGWRGVWVAGKHLAKMLHAGEWWRHTSMIRPHCSHSHATQGRVRMRQHGMVHGQGSPLDALRHQHGRKLCHATGVLQRFRQKQGHSLMTQGGRHTAGWDVHVSWWRWRWCWWIGGWWMQFGGIGSSMLGKCGYGWWWWLRKCGWESKFSGKLLV